MIAVIADDVSGAAEIASLAVEHGLSAEVQTSFTKADADVICVSTDSRAMEPAQAAAAVAAVTEAIVATRPEWIFKKCDSLLRGPVIAEARAVAQVTGRRRVLLVPANPSRQRVIRQGLYFIRGVPLHETAFARDPDHPRTTSRVVDLLGGKLDDVETPDIDSRDDVTRSAGTLTDDTLPVGGADFFHALLQSREPRPSRPHPAESTSIEPGPTLLVCGSAASWTERRTEASAVRVSWFGLPHDTGAVVRALQTGPIVLLGIGDGPAVPRLSTSALTGLLARTVAAVLAGCNVSRLLIEGGATSAAILRETGWTRLRARKTAAPGVCRLQPVAGHAPELVIKPGSYPWPSECWPQSGERS